MVKAHQKKNLLIQQPKVDGFFQLLLYILICLRKPPFITKLHKCLILPRDSSTPFPEPLGASRPLSPSTRSCTTRPEALLLPSPSFIAATPSSLMMILATSPLPGPSLDASVTPTSRSLLTLALPLLADSTCPSIPPVPSLVALSGPRTRCVWFQGVRYGHIG